MSHPPLDELLRVWSQAPSASAAARTLGIARRTLYHRCQSASLAEVLHAIAQIVATYETQLAEERQAHAQEQAAAEAQAHVVRNARERERARLKKQVTTRDEALANAKRQLAILNARLAGPEGLLEQQQRANEQLARENQALREENKRLKGSRSQMPLQAGDGNFVPPVRRTKRLITLDDSTPV